MNAIAGPGSHLETFEVAAYLDRRLAPPDRSRVETHLAECAECRGEVIAANRLLRTRARPLRFWLPLAAAAALVLLVPLRGLIERPSVTREPAIITAATPVPIAPRGRAIERRFIWSRVPGADRYRLTVFTPSGTVAWESQLAETTVVLPDSLGSQIAAGSAYYWKVEARVGFQRWVTSELTEFSFPGLGK